MNLVQFRFLSRYGKMSCGKVKIIVVVIFGVIFGGCLASARIRDPAVPFEHDLRCTEDNPERPMLQLKSKFETLSFLRMEAVEGEK